MAEKNPRNTQNPATMCRVRVANNIAYGISLKATAHTSLYSIIFLALTFLLLYLHSSTA